MKFSVFLVTKSSSWQKLFVQYELESESSFTPLPARLRDESLQRLDFMLLTLC